MTASRLILTQDISRDNAWKRIERYLSDEEAQKYLHQADKWRFRIVKYVHSLTTFLEIHL
jgi:hypothetical protein